jgi:acyl carrier protein
MTDPIEERVISIVARRVGVDRATITQTSTLEALGIPPCRGIEITFVIEDSFDINICLAACDLKLDAVGALVDAVRAALSRRARDRRITEHFVHHSLPRPASTLRCAAIQNELDRWLYAENAAYVYTWHSL